MRPDSRPVCGVCSLRGFSRQCSKHDWAYSITLQNPHTHLSRNMHRISHTNRRMYTGVYELGKSPELPFSAHLYYITLHINAYIHTRLCTHFLSLTLTFWVTKIHVQGHTHTDIYTGPGFHPQIIYNSTLVRNAKYSTETDRHTHDHSHALTAFPLPDAIRAPPTGDYFLTHHYR